MTNLHSNPPNPETQEVSPRRRRRYLKVLSFMIALVVGLIIGIGVYIMTAPPVEPSKEPPKLEFLGRAAVRRRPSLESKPIAYALKDSRHEILGSVGEWVHIRIQGEVKGWTQQHEGKVIPPPAPQPTSRQQAKQRLMTLVDRIRDLFR